MSRSAADRQVVTMQLQRQPKEPLPSRFRITKCYLEREPVAQRIYAATSFARKRAEYNKDKDRSLLVSFIYQELTAQDEMTYLDSIAWFDGDNLKAKLRPSDPPEWLAECMKASINGEPLPPDPPESESDDDLPEDERLPAAFKGQLHMLGLSLDY